mgnify:CR=1 FL=1
MGLMRVKVAARRERCLNVRTRQAHSPFHRTLVQFNFSFQPSEDEVGSRAGHVQFRDDVANVILLSSPSGGETPTGGSPEVGSSVYFVRAHQLLEGLR